ncbi:thiamine phosphate synthase, partial [Pontiella sp.]|uniref:thiamine phosphate synthase n=1 Tax=Pontiella sp. TaxID=2837462 RepID=UPI00356254DE
MNTDFGLYLILTDPVAGYEKCAEAAVNENIRYLQLRMKNAAHEEVVAMGRRIKKITAGSLTRLIMNDSIEAAIESDADGIHLGQTDIPIPEARRQWNTDGKIFGLST